jgi:hypothetical protein
MTTAFDALRRHARQRNIKLTDLALAVIRGDTDPSALAVGPPSA